MRSVERNLRLYIASIAMLAGFVDVVGFLELRGYFVSFMSGNTTRLAAEVAAAGGVLMPTCLIAMFVFGVVAGEYVGRRGAAQHERNVLALVLVSILIACTLSVFGRKDAAMLSLTASMGALNAVFPKSSRLPVGLTYMTGTLVGLGREFVDRLLGDRDARPVLFLVHWAALLAGGVLGGLLHASWQAGSLVAAVVWICLLMATRRIAMPS